MKQQGDQERDKIHTHSQNGSITAWRPELDITNTLRELSTFATWYLLRPTSSAEITRSLTVDLSANGNWVGSDLSKHTMITDVQSR
jgi:hypothetical protein